ncbi:hypothetical protein SCA_1813 [Staphylococcus carnosus subsp. carnosus TM300]|uniref:Uncharacterized protein n=1 Tax=Staphylococcus carnosus (strain TM300) TaxID=396513 RepID=B9DLT4_STACT|nr:hypothetical protein SCA_1813 [Staphylococcus carnosus subsp. carnosus TM300]
MVRKLVSNLSQSSDRKRGTGLSIAKQVRELDA